MRASSPIDDRPRLDPTIRHWMGDSRGHWEGETLVVETTNYNDQMTFYGANEGLHVVERFTRVDADTLGYEFTVTDPSVFARAWTAAFPMAKSDLQLYEYACHEGNYALPNILRGARSDERAAAQSTGR